MNKPKISVILPIYCAEKYIKQCLDSLINQTFKDFEIICVNDGSTDNTLSLLQEYKERNSDKNIIIIDKKNEGVWQARISRNKKCEWRLYKFCR